MNDKNAYLVDGPAPTPRFDYVSPWSYVSLAERVNAIAPDNCCKGLVDLLLTVAREADQKLSKAQLDVWALEGISRNDMTLRVVDRFTTQDGSWDVSPKPYSIDQAHRDRYEAGRLIDGSGGQNHIFVKPPAGSIVMFSSDGVRWSEGALKGGWWNWPMFHEGSAYNTANGTGSWRVRVDNAIVAEGIGLPDGLHVSSFLVVEDVADGPTPIEPPAQGMSAHEAAVQAYQLLGYALERWPA